MHDAYMATLDQNLVAQYADCRKTIDGWNASIIEIKQMMPPQQPAAPSITTWLAQAPDPGLQGKQVQYLIEFANKQGPSGISSGSGFVPIVSGQTPQLSIPTDPNGAATKRNVYRQLMDATGTVKDREMVDIVNDNTTTVWVDGVKS